MHEVLVNRLGGLSLPRKSVVRLTDRPDMTLDVYRGRKTTIQLYTDVQMECDLCISDFHLKPSSVFNFSSVKKQLNLFFSGNLELYFPFLF